MIAIRPAAQDDTKFLLDSAISLGHETIWAGTNLYTSYGESAARLLTLIEQDDKLVIIAEHEGTPVGCLIGEICSHIFIPHARYFYEHVLYVNPLFRRKRAGVKLWRYAKDWSKARGVDRGVYGKPKVGVVKNSRQRIEEVHWHLWGVT